MTAALLAAVAATAPPWLLPLGAAAAFGAIVVAVLLVALPSRRTRLPDAVASNGPRRSSLARSISARAATFAGEALDRPGRRRMGSLLRTLERAGLPVRSGEALVALAGGGLALLLVGTVLGGLLAGLLLLAAAVLIAWLWVNRRIADRRKAFEKQLPDLLRLLASNLRAGHAVNIALASVAEEMESPASEELNRVISENRLGRDMTDAMQAMADRLDSVDFQWVVQAIEVNRQVGGDLAEVLDNVLATISERARLRGVVRALSADGRLSALVLALMPVGVVGFVLLRDPGYFDEFLASTGGRIAVAVGIALMAIGTFWTKKITKVRF